MLVKRRKRKKTPFRPLKFILIGIGIALLFGVVSVSAKELYGDNTVAEYPYAVGDTFTHNGRVCTTAYSWSDDSSAVAVCEGRNKQTIIEYDLNSNIWSHWNGCLRFDNQGRYIGGRKHSLLGCYGPSLIDVHSISKHKD